MSGGYRVFALSESGNVVAVTARLGRVTVNSDLTDTGLSEVSIPNIGSGIEDGREDVEERVWNRKLPFKAQKVVDLGYACRRHERARSRDTFYRYGRRCYKYQYDLRLRHVQVKPAR